MNVVVGVALAMLAVAVLLVLFRLVRGPRTLDRVVAVDVLVVLLVAGVAVGMVDSGGENASLLAVVALLGFVGSVATGELVGRRESMR